VSSPMLARDAMQVVGSCLVVTIDVRPGVRVAAVWSGGPYVNLHAVDRGGFGVAVESWYVWDDWLDAAKIPRTLEALESFAMSRLDDMGSDDLVLDLVEDFAVYSDEQSSSRRRVVESLN